MGGGHGPAPELRRDDNLASFHDGTQFDRAAIGSQEHTEQYPFWNNEQEKMKPRSVWSRFVDVMQLNIASETHDRLSTTNPQMKPAQGMLYALFGPVKPLKPETYTDKYMRPNPCPEEYWFATYRWPRTKIVNPKVKPPTNGKYDDYYHYVAFRNWFMKEREVYIAQIWRLNMTLNRCVGREGAEMRSAGKNCRHIFNKVFAMSRAEEFEQTLLYMALTGNSAIRETPYPENFVDEKRKMYDDWLFRSRHRRPTDDL